MSSQHKTKLLGWHPSDPTLKPWVKAEAGRRGVPQREILDEALAAYRTVVEANDALGRTQR